jgi:hypothetical protein
VEADDEEDGDEFADFAARGGGGDERVGEFEVMRLMNRSNLIREDDTNDFEDKK